MGEKPVWLLFADVALEIPADDEDEARDLAERFVDEAVQHDSRVRAAVVTRFIWGPEIKDDEE